ASWASGGNVGGGGVGDAGDGEGTASFFSVREAQRRPAWMSCGTQAHPVATTRIAAIPTAISSLVLIPIRGPRTFSLPFSFSSAKRRTGSSLAGGGGATGSRGSRGAG